ncbi:MAG TPA: hypothetical protein VJA94_07225 [Candidatus Angelobacter sp.]
MNARRIINKAAAKYDQAEEHEKAAHHAYLAHGHTQQALHHDGVVARIHVEHCDNQATTASEQEGDKKNAA